MYNDKSIPKQLAQFIFAALFLAAFSWVNFQLAKENQAGYQFYAQWQAGRSLAYQGVSPYKNQPNAMPEAGDSISISREGFHFNTPIYSLIFVLPFSLVEDYWAAYRFWLVFSELVVFGVLITTLKLIRIRFSRVLMIIMVVSVFLNFYTLQALISGSLIVLAIFFLLLACLNLQSERYELAGILLAFTTIQVNILWLIYILMIIWSISSKKWAVMVWFFAGTAILSIVGLFVIPDWLLSYARLLWNFTDHSNLIPLGEVLGSLLPGVGRQLGMAFTLIMLIILLIEAYLVRGKEIRWLVWTTSLTIVCTIWIGVPVHPSVFFVLIIPLLQVFLTLAQRTGKDNHWMVGLGLLISLGFFWWLHFRLNLPIDLVELGEIHFIVFPLFLIIGLFWTRWWAIRPVKLFIEEIRGDENPA